MKKTLLLAAALVVCITFSAFASKHIRLTQAELKSLIKENKNLILVDVREPELYAKGHIKGAINIPYDGAHKRVLKELNPDDDVVFICHGGPMGDELGELLVNNNYKNVYNLMGGMRWWNGPLEK